MSQTKHMLEVILDPGELVRVLQTQHEGVSNDAGQTMCVAATSSLLVADISGDRL